MNNSQAPILPSSAPIGPNPALIPSPQVNVTSPNVAPVQDYQNNIVGIEDLWNNLPKSVDDHNPIYTPQEQAKRYHGENMFNPMQNNEDVYGKNQSTLSQLGNGIAKTLGYTGISFAQALTFQPDSDIATEAKQKLEDIFPSYYTDKQQKSNFNWLPFSGGSTNFYFDKLLKGTGDMVGMIGATALQDAAIGVATEGVGVLPFLSRQIAAGTMKASKWLSGVDKTAEFLRDAGLEGDVFKASQKALEAQQYAKAGAVGLSYARNLGTNSLFSYYMAAQGSKQYAESVRKDLIDHYKESHYGVEPDGEDLSKIESMANDASTAKFSTDLSLFMVQALALPGLLRAFRPSASLIDGIEAQGGKVKLPETPTTGEALNKLETAPIGNRIFQNVIKPFAHNAAILGGITAVTESGSEAIKKYFEDQYDGKATGTVNDAINDIYTGVSKALGNSEGIGSVLTSAFIGGLVGNLHHGVEDITNRRKGLATQDQATQAAVARANDWTVTGLFDANHRSAVDVTKNTNDLDDSIKTNDPWKYKNAKKNAFFGFIYSGLESGLFDVRKEQLKLLRDLPDEALKNVFQDPEGDPVKMRQHVDLLSQKADELKKIHDAISTVVTQPDVYRQNARTPEHEDINKNYKDVEEYKRILTKLAYDKREFTDDLRQIDAENRNDHPLLTNRLLESIATREGREKLKREYSQQIALLTHSLDNADGTSFYTSELHTLAEQRSALKDAHTALDHIQSLQNIDNIPAYMDFSKKFHKVLNFELNGRKPADEEAIPYEQTDKLIQRSAEILANKAARVQADHAYSSLFSQDGFDEFKKDKEEYKTAQSTPDTEEQLRKDDTTYVEEPQDESRVYTLDPKADLKGYEVSKEDGQDGTSIYSIKDLKGNVVKSFDTRKEANEQAKEYNKRFKVPKTIKTSMERNQDGTIKALDENGKPVSIHPDLFSAYSIKETPEEIVATRESKYDDILQELHKETLTKTPVIPTPTPEQVEEDTWEPAKKPGQYTYFSITRANPDNGYYSNHEKHLDHFFGTLGQIRKKLPVGHDLRQLFITKKNEQSWGLDGLVEHMLKNSPTKYKEDEVLLSVFTSYDPLTDKHTFIDAQGNPVEAGRLDSHLVGTMPLDRPDYASNPSETRERKNVTAEEKIAKLEQYHKFREEAFKATTKGATKSSSFKVSRGFKESDANKTQYAIEGSLIEKGALDKLEQVVHVTTTGTQDVLGNNIKSPNGALMFKDDATGTLEFMNSRFMNTKEADSLYAIFKDYANLLNGVKHIKWGTEEETRGTLKATMNEYKSFLEGFSFYRGVEPKDSKANSIYLSKTGPTDANNKGYYLYIGDAKFPFVQETFFPENEQAIKEALQKVRTNANKKLLEENKPFREFFLDGSKLSRRDWTSYQHFLLADEVHVDGKSQGKRDVEDIPFRTSVPPIDQKDPLSSNFTGKYATLEDFASKPSVETGKKETKTEEKFIKRGPNKIGYTVDKEGNVTLNNADADSAFEKFWKSSEANKTKQIKDLSEFYGKELKDKEDIKGAWTDFVLRQAVGEELPGEDANSTATTDEIEREAQTPPSSISDLDNLPMSEDVPFRLVDPKDLNYTLHDIEQSEAWFKENMPFLGHRVDNLIKAGGNYAYGRYIDGHAEWYINAKKGTIEHEAFEGIWASFTSAKEKKNLLNEFKEREGSFTEHSSGKEIPYSLASDHQVKEQLAEELGHYVLDGHLYESPKKGNFIAQMFHDFVQWVKSIFNGSIAKYFKKIDTGYYKDATPINNYKGEELRIANLDISESYAVTRGVVSNVVKLMFGTNDSIMKFDSAKIDLTEELRKIKDGYETEVLNPQTGKPYRQTGIKDKFVSPDLRDSAFTQHEYYKIDELAGVPEGKRRGINKTQYEQYMKVWKNMDAHWWIKDQKTDEQKRLTVEQNVIDFLKTFKFKEDTSTPEERSNSEYLRNAFEIDSKANASTAVKLLIATMQEVGADGKEKLDPYTLMPLPVDYGATFALISDKLSEVNTLPEMENELRKLALLKPNINTLLRRLKVDQRRNLDDIKLRTAFLSTFGKQGPTAYGLAMHKDGSNTFFKQNDNVGLADQVQSWLDVMKLQAKEGTAIVTNPSGDYKFVGTSDKGVLTGDITKQLAFLQSVGITEFNTENYNALNVKDKSKLTETIAGLYKYMSKEVIAKEGTEGEVDDSIGITAGHIKLAGRLKSLAQLYFKAEGISDTTFYNIEAKQQAKFVGPNYVSITTNDLNNAPDKESFLASNPHFASGYRSDGWYVNDWLYSGNTRITRNKLALSYFQGLTSAEDKDATPLGGLSSPRRMTMQINAELNKLYYTLVPADSATEWVEEMDHRVKYSEFDNRDAVQNKIYDIFNGYYQTERKLAMKSDGTLDKNYVSTMHEIDGGYTKPTLDPAALDKFVENNVDANIKFLQDNHQIKIEASKDNKSLYRIVDLSTEWCKSEGIPISDGRRKLPKPFTEDELRNFFRFREVNFMVNNIEMHKLFFGDLNDIKDPLKRYKSALSPRMASVYGDPEFNKTLTENLNKGLLPGDVYHAVYTDNIRTLTLQDQPSYQENIVKDEHISKDISSPYSHGNSTDGGGFITPVAYFEMLYKGQVVTKDHDALMQNIFARDRQLMLKDGWLQQEDPTKSNYYRPELAARDEKAVGRGYNGAVKITDLKPVYFGVDSNGNTVLDKYALMFMSYERARKGPLETIYRHMVEDGIHYAVQDSGRKIGLKNLEKQAWKLYDDSGQINKELPTEDMKSTLNYKYIGIQTPTEGTHATNPYGTQVSTMVAMDFLNNGIPKDYNEVRPWKDLTEKQRRDSSKQYDTITHLKEVREAMMEHHQKALYDMLGIKETKDGYQIPDKTKLQTLLKEELLRRETPENLRDALVLDKDGNFATPLEGLANYKQIKQILSSFIEKRISKPKQNGGMKIMEAGTVVGNVDGKEIKTVKIEGEDQTAYVSDGLKFYEAEYDEKGNRTKVGRMEIIVSSRIPEMMRKHPRWTDATDQELLVHLNSTAEGRSILEGIGFRIPTQGMNSIEAFTIKGFTPSYMGDVVVVPEAITTKAGSDFDVDKLNTYMKNMYLAKNGDAKLVPYYEGLSREDAINKFKDIAWEQLGQQKTKATVTDLLNSHYGDDLSVMEDELFDDWNIPAEKLYDQSLQNEYYDTMGKLVLDPMNYERLLKPNSAEQLKAISKHLTLLAPDEFNGDSKVSILNSKQMAAARHAFIIFKNELGKAAMGQKMHSVDQMNPIVLDGRNIKNIDPTEKRILRGDISIMLPYNTIDVDVMTIDGRETVKLPTISSINNVNGDHISDYLSQIIDGCADIAKGAWIANLIQSPLVTSTFISLTRLGVDPEVAAMFINQPIIREYVKELELQEKTYMVQDWTGPERKLMLRKFPVDTTKEDLYSQILGKKGSYNNRMLDVKNFEDNIEKYYSSKTMGSNEKNLEQHLILSEFIKYNIISSHMFNIQAAVTHDTKPATDFAAQVRREGLYEKASEQNLFTYTKNGKVDSGAEGVLKGTHLGTLEDRVKAASTEIMESVFPQTMHKDVRDIMRNLLKKFPQQMSQDNYERAAFMAEDEMLSAAMQQATGINTRIKQLLVDGRSNTAKRIVDLRKRVHDKDPMSDLARNKFLNDLVVVARNNVKQVKNIYLANKPSSSFDIDVYSNALRELRDNPQFRLVGDDLYNAFLETALLQSGLTNSKASMIKFIPSEDFSKILSPVVRNLPQDLDGVQAFVDDDSFFRNKWKDDRVVPHSVETWNTDKTGSEIASSDVRPPAHIMNAWKDLLEEQPQYKVITKTDSKGNKRTVTPENYNAVTGKKGKYTIFKINPDNKQGQYKFIALDAIERADAQANMENPNISEHVRPTKYLLRRVENSEGQPLLLEGRHIFVPISPKGDGGYAEEHTPYQNSVLDNGGYQVPYEIPMDRIYMALKDAKRPTKLAIKTELKSNMDRVPEKGVVPTKVFRTWDLGKFEGDNEAKHEKEIDNNTINFPDRPIGDNGESFNQFSERTLKAFKEVLDNAEDGTMILTHSSVLKMFKLWDNMKRPEDLRVDPRRYVKESTTTGTFEQFEGKNGTIYVGRHGETEDNVKGNLRDSKTQLTEKGLVEAQTLGAEMKERGIKKIITSDLDRAVHTSNLIADAIKNKEVKPEEGSEGTC